MKWIITHRGPMGPSQYEIEGRRGKIGVRRVQHPTALRPYWLAGPAVPEELQTSTFRKLADAKAAAEAALLEIDITSAIGAAFDALESVLDLDRDGMCDALKGSGWRDVEDMVRREFAGAYRGYYPSVSMWLLPEAAIAVAFDAIAIAMSDPRRALRNTAGGDLTAATAKADADA
jgi:hypothetical protein